MQPYYELQEGALNPREQIIGWRTFANFDTREGAMQEAKKHKGHLWRIIECKVLWHSTEARKLMGGEP